jgi:hypothetical protein
MRKDNVAQRSAEELTTEELELAFGAGDGPGPAVYNRPGGSPPTPGGSSGDTGEGYRD